MSRTSSGAICVDELASEGTNANLTHHVSVVTVSDNLELVGVVFIEEGNGDAHDAVVVAGNLLVSADLDGIEVFVPVIRRLTLQVLAKLQVVRHGHEIQGFMAATVVQVSVPTRRRHARYFPARLFVDMVKARPVVRYFEEHSYIEVRASKPHPVVLDEWKDLQVGDRIGVADDEKLFLVLCKLSNVLLEKRERRVADHYVRLLEQFDALGAAEVAASRETCAVVGVPLKEEFEIFDAGRAVSVEIRHFLDLDGNRHRLLAIAIALGVLTERELCAGDRGAIVAGGDEFFQSELVEIGGEVLEEVALEGVVAVAVDDLVAEGVGIELKVGLDFFLDVYVLGVELVLLGRLRGAQALVQRFAFHCAVVFLWFP